jgi:methylenetetrahydrofolate dehydrogenase (NADP+)/methenyltetrahydrofolate cyclohydrolase
MILLDGKKISSDIIEDLRLKLKSDNKGYKPGLGIILIGNRKDSLKYIEYKKKVCSKIGIKFHLIHLEETCEEENILKVIRELNNNTSINGIIIQLPLPDNFNTEKILDMVVPEKDVDGFHQTNAGKLFLNRGLDFAPCTPLGCMRLIDHYGIDVEGLNICVVGCSNVVGLPLSMMLLQRNATVTICNKYTKNLKGHTIESDMIFSCCGVPNIIKEDMVKDNVVIVDIGINYVDGKLVGDVDFEGVKDKCSYITPVPGGVGPMTIALLMEQTVEAWNLSDASENR